MTARHRSLLIALFSGLAFWIATWLWGEGFFQPGPIRFLFDHHDLRVYFESAKWVHVPGGAPFRNAYSEYPLAANLLFAFVRGLSWLAPVFSDPFANFCWWWVGLATSVYGLACATVAREGRRALAVLLAPAILYFSVYRYDLYPALACWIALEGLRRDRYRRAAVWLGISIALKGYTAVTLPALFVYLGARVGYRQGLFLSALTLAPMALSLGVTWLWAGWAGVVMPFRFHAARGFNGESTWDVLNFMTFDHAAPLLERVFAWKLPLLVQAAFALGAGAMRPKKFDRLVAAFLFAITGFITASVFHSPQFVLWIAAVAVFSRDRFILGAACALGWLSYLYFPILYDVGNKNAFKAAVALVALTRLALLLRLVVQKRPSSFSTF